MSRHPWDRVPLGATCPHCLQLAQLDIGSQAFCGNDDCDVVMWDPAATREEFERDATPIDLSGIPGPDRRPS